MSSLKTITYSGIAFLAVGLGIAGIFLPVLPTTPFLLLAMFLFVRSNKRMARWLEEHPQLGPYIKCYTSGERISLGRMLKILFTLWTTIAISIILLIENRYIQFGLVIIAIAVTIHIAYLRYRR